MTEKSLVGTIKIIDDENLVATIKSVVGFVAERPQKDLDLCLQEKLRETLPELGNARIENIVLDTVDYVNSISDERTSLNLAKKRGMNRKEWLYRQFNEIDKDKFKDDNEFGSVASSIQQSIFSAYQDTINARLQAKGKPGNITLSPDGQPSVGWNESTIKHVFFNTATVLHDLTVFGLSDVEADQLDYKGQSKDNKISDYLAPIILSDDSTEVEKALAISLKIAADKGYIEIPNIIAKFISEDSELDASFKRLPMIKETLGEIPIYSSIATEAVDLLKIAKKVGDGEMDVEEAIDAIVDSATSAAVGVAKVMFRKGGQVLGSNAGAFVGSFISTVFGPAAIPVCAKIGSVVGGFVGENFAEPVVRGIKYIGGKAKKAVNFVVEKVCDIGSKVVNFVSDIAGGIGSFFKGLFG
jgi:hypothetical protein